MNIALTGSSGLLGSNLVNDLREIGHEVLCISSSKSSHKDAVYHYDEIATLKLNFQIDCFFHLASINSNLDKSEILLELSLMEKAIECMKDLNCKKIIFFSTSKVYGDNSFDLQEFDESSELSPLCSYGAAKTQCEEIIQKSASNQTLDYLIFRLPPVLMDHSKSGVGKMLDFVKKGIPIPSFKIGDFNQRSFLSYDLLVYVLKVTLCDLKRVDNNIFNLCDSEVISINNLLRKFGERIDKKPRIVYLPHFLFQAMIRINRLQLILCRLFGNFHISNAKLKKSFQLPEHF
ncbi:MAG: NAD-dependent epimerase/dehydratase family protein [Paracoccaceae bacterium]